MARNEDTRSEATLAQHRALISQYVLRGTKTQVEIADELGINQATVSRDIKALKQEWKKAASRDFEQYLAEALAARKDLLSEWWDGWGRSKEDATKQSAVKQKIGDKGIEKAGRETENNVGDPRFLTGVSGEWTKIERLVGLGAPEKLLMPDVSEWTDEELEAYSTTGKLPTRPRRVGGARAEAAQPEEGGEEAEA